MYGRFPSSAFPFVPHPNLRDYNGVRTEFEVDNRLSDLVSLKDSERQFARDWTSLRSRT